MPLDGWGTITDGEKLRWGESQYVEMDDVWEVKSAQRVNHGIERWSEKGQRGVFQCHPVIQHTLSLPLLPHFISFPLSLSLTYPLFIFPLTDRYMHFSHSNTVTFMNVHRLQSEVRERKRGRLCEIKVIVTARAAASDDSAIAQEQLTRNCLILPVLIQSVSNCTELKKKSVFLTHLLSLSISLYTTLHLLL